MKNRNLKLFYIHELLFQFSDTMLIIVLPIFLFKLFGQINAVFIFQFGWNIIYGLLLIPVFNLAMKWKKPRYFMGLGIIFYILAQFFFSQSTPENPYFIIPAFFAFSLYVSFYWMVRHWFFSTISDHTKIGKQISYLGIIRILVGFVAPIIGGMVSYFISFNITFILGVIAGFASLIPILFFDAPPHPRGYDFKKVKAILKKPELKVMRSAYLLEGFSHYTTGTVWVMAFAIFLGNVKDLGILIGFSTLAAATLTWVTGKLFDKQGRKKWLTRFTFAKVGSVLLYPTLFIFPSAIYIYVVEMINRFVMSMHQTTVDAYLFAYSNKIHPIHFHWNREIHLTIGRLITSGTLSILFLFAPPSFLWLVIAMGAFSLLGWLNLKRSDHLLR